MKTEEVRQKFLMEPAVAKAMARREAGNLRRKAEETEEKGELKVALLKLRQDTIKKRQEQLKAQQEAQQAGADEEAAVDPSLLSLPRAPMDIRNPLNGAGQLDLMGAMGPEGAVGGRGAQLAMRGQTLNTAGYNPQQQPGMAPGGGMNPSITVDGQTYTPPPTMTTTRRSQEVSPQQVAPGSFMPMQSSQTQTVTEPNVLTPRDVLWLKSERENMAGRLLIEQQRNQLLSREAIVTSVARLSSDIDAPAGVLYQFSEKAINGDSEGALRLIQGYGTTANSTIAANNALIASREAAAEKATKELALLDKGIEMLSNPYESTDDLFGGIIYGINNAPGVKVGPFSRPAGAGGPTQESVRLSWKNLGVALKSDTDPALAGSYVAEAGMTIGAASKGFVTWTTQTEDKAFLPDSENLGVEVVPYQEFIFHTKVMSFDEANRPLPASIRAAFPALNDAQIKQSSRQWAIDRGIADEKGLLFSDPIKGPLLSAQYNRLDDLDSRGITMRLIEETDPALIREWLGTKANKDLQGAVVRKGVESGTSTQAMTIDQINELLKRNEQILQQKQLPWSRGR